MRLTTGEDVTPNDQACEGLFDSWRSRRVAHGVAHHRASVGAKSWLEAQTTPGGHRRFLHRHVELFARQRGLTLNHGGDDTTRVLIVDDDEPFAQFLVEALSERPEAITTEVAQSGFEAGQKIQTYVPHIGFSI